MRLYLDDDSVDPLLIRLLRQQGHDVENPADVNLVGAVDPRHLRHAIHEERVFLTGNHRDFELLHDLIAEAHGTHSGMLVVRRDNNPRRDLTPRGIVHALQKLLLAKAPIEGQLIVLNHWR